MSPSSIPQRKSLPSLVNRTLKAVYGGRETGQTTPRRQLVQEQAAETSICSTSLNQVETIERGEGCGPDLYGVMLPTTLGGNGGEYNLIRSLKKGFNDR